MTEKWDGKPKLMGDYFRLSDGKRMAVVKAYEDFIPPEDFKIANWEPDPPRDYELFSGPYDNLPEFLKVG